MSQVSHADSYYAATQRYDVHHPALAEDIDVDVCVIGAGITGSSAALHLAERGYRVAMIEAQRVGWGASGRSGGQKIAGFGCDMSKLRRIVGADDARRLWDMSVEAVQLLDERVERHAIPCDPVAGHLHVGLKPRHERELEQWHEELEGVYGYTGLEILRGEALQAQVGSPLYTSGLYDPHSGHIHPLNYTLGLAEAAHEAGAQLFESTPATRIEHGTTATVYTPGGRIRARHVILGANAYIDGLAPVLRRRIMPVGTYIVATEPLGEERARRLLPTNAAVADMNFVLDYFRLSADHRLLFGGRVSYSRIEPLSIRRSIRARMIKVFPELADVGIDYAWGGYVAITHNRAPHFGRLADNVYFAQGFSGHGIALTGLAGKLMAEAIAGREERFDIFTRIPHMPFPGGEWFRTPALVAAMTWARIRDALP
ncbi:FAD-dependent oxidoreductase [Acidihalobacter yilgarnensis]|uniref:FAD-dependent oxidoreductase n=1 Tax=Acidihalobacter yilgarnensis TaxID=2819280 RepID=A0A1D8ILS6_9GAMM|nr:FAD-binding oxidoreductase [Acidihalobacter yilgarnensis]AOU97412.1 FAD-dependent oxidoreductase [Acidihalobacter yilgarnensis]